MHTEDTEIHEEKYMLALTYTEMHGEDTEIYKECFAYQLHYTECKAFAEKLSLIKSL
jgi:hypothetical protein